MKKTTFGVPTRADTNQAVQSESQKQARSLKFQI